MPTVGVSRLNTDVLYFVSDRENGQGGLDIWFTYYDSKRKEWKEPKNCGRELTLLPMNLHLIIILKLKLYILVQMDTWNGRSRYIQSFWRW